MEDTLTTTSATLPTVSLTPFQIQKLSQWGVSSLATNTMTTAPTTQSPTTPSTVRAVAPPPPTTTATAPRTHRGLTLTAAATTIPSEEEEVETMTTFPKSRSVDSSIPKQKQHHHHLNTLQHQKEKAPSSSCRPCPPRPCNYCKLSTEMIHLVKLEPCGCNVCNHCFIQWFLLQKSSSNNKTTTKKKQCCNIECNKVVKASLHPLRCEISPNGKKTTATHTETIALMEHIYDDEEDDDDDDSSESSEEEDESSESSEEEDDNESSTMHPMSTDTPTTKVTNNTATTSTRTPPSNQRKLRTPLLLENTNHEEENDSFMNMEEDLEPSPPPPPQQLLVAQQVRAPTTTKTARASKRKRAPPDVLAQPSTKKMTTVATRNFQQKKAPPPQTTFPPPTTTTRTATTANTTPRTTQVERSPLSDEERFQIYYRLFFNDETPPPYIPFSASECVQLLLGYYAQYGNFHIPADTEWNKRLRVYSSHLRAGRMTLEEDNNINNSNNNNTGGDKQLLLDKGFEFDNDTTSSTQEQKTLEEVKEEEKRFRWHYKLYNKVSFPKKQKYISLTPYECFELVLDFYNQYGHFNIPQDTKAHKRLYVYSNDLRARRKVLKDKDRKILQEKGFVFDREKFVMMTVDQRIDQYVAYKKAKNGPDGATTPLPWKSLSSWEKSVRKFDIKTTEEQRDRLTAAGFDWTRRQTQNEQRWNQRLEELKAYKAQFGDTCIPLNYLWNGSNSLTIWVHCQRKYKIMGKLRADRLQALNDIDFAWHGKQGKRNRKWPTKKDKDDSTKKTSPTTATTPTPKTNDSNTNKDSGTNDSIGRHTVATGATTERADEARTVTGTTLAGTMP